MTKEEILIGGGILLGGAALVGLCLGIGNEAVKEYDDTEDLRKNLDAAKKAWQQNKRTNAEVTPETEAVVNDVASRSSFAQVDIMSKLLKTEQWVRYAYFYMTDNSAELFELDTETCELCNGISVLAGFGKMYPRYAVADLKDYDLKVCDMTKTFLVDLDEVSAYVTNGNFQIKMKLRAEALMNGSAVEQKASTIDETPVDHVTAEQQAQANQEGQNWKLGSDGLYHLGKQVFKEDENLYRPFATNAEEAKTVSAPFKQPKEMSNRDFEKLNSVITPAITGTDKFWYEYDQNGLLILKVCNEQGMMINNVPVDLGDIVGGSHIHVMGNYNINGYVQSVLIDAEKHPDLASKVIQNPMYLLDNVEVGVVFEERKISSWLLKYFDMTGTPFLDEMSDPTAKRLEKRLQDIYTIVRNNTDPNFDVPRFRFDHFENPDNFVVVSDSHVSRKIPGVMSGSYDDSNALTFEQRGNTVLQTFKGMTTAFDTTLITVKTEVA